VKHSRRKAQLAPAFFENTRRKIAISVSGYSSATSLPSAIIPDVAMLA
jgi:hypothetical protein